MKSIPRHLVRISLERNGEYCGRIIYCIYTNRLTTNCTPSYFVYSQTNKQKLLPEKSSHILCNCSRLWHFKGQEEVWQRFIGQAPVIPKTEQSNTRNNLSYHTMTSDKEECDVSNGPNIQEKTLDDTPNCAVAF